MTQCRCAMSRMGLRKMTYLENRSYDLAVRLLAKRINEESIFGGNAEPVVTVDTLKVALGELCDIWPESSRSNNGVGYVDVVVDNSLPLRRAVLQQRTHLSKGEPYDG